MKTKNSSLLLCLLLAAGIAAQDVDTPEQSEPAPIQQDQDPQNLAAEDSAKKSEDEKILDDILEDVESYKYSFEDSTVLQEKKKRQLKLRIREIQKKNVGRSLSFANLQVIDVEPEQEFTKYGRSRANSIVKQMKKDPEARALIDSMGKDWQDNPFLRFMVVMHLAACQNCLRPTGRYEVRFCLPGNDFSSHTITKTVNSEKAALAYKKGSLYPVSGSVLFVVIDDNLKAKIVLK